MLWREGLRGLGRGRRIGSWWGGLGMGRLKKNEKIIIKPNQKTWLSVCYISRILLRKSLLASLIRSINSFMPKIYLQLRKMINKQLI
jgi:hypothetical protein